MRFVTTTDIHIGDALVAIRLTRSDYEEKTSGVIMTRLEEFHTDADGFLQVDLLPAKALYHVTVYDTVQDIAIHHDFIVPVVEDPNTVLLLPDLIVPPDTTLSSMPYDEEAMAKIIQAKAEALAAAAAAKASADLAHGAIDSTAASAAIAEAAKVVIQAAQIAVAADATEVRQNTVLVANYTGDALQHKIDAQAAATVAASSATAAHASEQQAIQSADAAKISEDTAAESIVISQAAVVTTTAARDQAVSARNTAVAAKDEAVEAKNTTVQKAAELAAQLHAFNEIYIGKFAQHPTVDGNGNPLKVGAIYENTTEGKLYQYETALQWHPYDEESQQQMNNALLSANSAAASAGSATASMNAAEASKIAAQTARTGAEAAKTAADASATTATSAKDTAIAARDTAVAAKDTASQKAVDAAASAAAAAASAASAAAAQIPSDWTQTDNTKKDFIKNKPVLAAVATTGAKADVGLGNVDNTSDVNKPVSTPQQNALNLKVNTTDVPTLVRQNSLGYRAIVEVSANRAITGADLGCMLYSYQKAIALTIPRPDAIGAKTGDKMAFLAIKGAGVTDKITISTSGGAIIIGQAGLSSVDVLYGQQLELISDGYAQWQIGINTIRVNDNPEFAAKAPLASPDFTGAPTVPTAPLQSNGADIANTQWVKRRGFAFPTLPGVGLQTGTTALRVQDLGHWIQFNQAGCVLTVGAVLSSSDYSGATFTVRAPYAGTIQTVNGPMYPPDTTVGVYSYSMRAGETVTFVNSGGFGWYAVAIGVGTGALNSTYAPINNPTFTGLLSAKAVNLDSINGSFIGGMKNRIINGDMRINQRAVPNSGITTYGYTLDRWECVVTVAGKVTYGHNLYNVATKAPGFPYYIGFGATGAYTAEAGEAFLAQQPIEGHNLADLQYGSAGAKTCTLTAWVYSNLAGTHSGAVYSNLGNKSFVFTFPLAANTWTFISITVPGDTTSAMNVDHQRGLSVRFNLGSGSTFLSATVGSWVTGDIVGATGSANMLASNANFLFTGVQFEAGQATPFSRRPISEELAMCQRYYETGDGPNLYIGSTAVYANAAYGRIDYKVTKRFSPAVTTTGWQYFSAGANTAFTPAVNKGTVSGFNFRGSGLTNWNGWAGEGTWAANAEI